MEGLEMDTKGEVKGSEQVDFLESESYKVPKNIKSLDDVKEYWREEKRKIKEGSFRRHEYDTKKSLVSLTWKRERLFIEEGTTYLPGRSMTEDIDPDFFKIISGRPIKEKKSISTYLADIRSCFLTRLQTGYYMDEILFIDDRGTVEVNQLDQVRNQFLSILQGFELFLKDDHMLSKDLLTRARQQAAKSKEKLQLLNSLRKALRETEMEILLLEEKWRNSRMLQEFLYVTAPSDWRKVNDPTYGRNDSEGSVSDPCRFDRFRESPQERNISLESKISRFIQDKKDCQRHALYFTDPQQIHNIIAELESNNLRALNHWKKLDFPAANAVTDVLKLRMNLEECLTKLEEDVEYIKRMVENEEEKAVRMREEVHNVIYGLFRSLITNEEHLSMRAFLEDAYEDAVGSIDTNPDPVTMMREIESKYENLSLALDVLPTNLVVQTTKKYFREQKRELREAKQTGKKVHQMEMLLKRLSRALQAPKKAMKDRKITPRSHPPEEQLTQAKEAKLFTSEQLEKKFLFQRTTETTLLHRPLCI